MFIKSRMNKKWDNECIQTTFRLNKMNKAHKHNDE